jgi:hypothetical protein
MHLVDEFKVFARWFTRSHSRPSLFGTSCPSNRELGSGLQRLVNEPLTADGEQHENNVAAIGIRH